MLNYVRHAMVSPLTWYVVFGSTMWYINSVNTSRVYDAAFGNNSFVKTERARELKAYNDSAVE